MKRCTECHKRIWRKPVYLKGFYTRHRYPYHRRCVTRVLGRESR